MSSDSKLYCAEPNSLQNFSVFCWNPCVFLHVMVSALQKCSFTVSCFCASCGFRTTACVLYHNSSSTVSFPPQYVFALHQLLLYLHCSVLTCCNVYVPFDCVHFNCWILDILRCGWSLVPRGMPCFASLASGKGNKNWFLQWGNPGRFWYP